MSNIYLTVLIIIHAVYGMENNLINDTNASDLKTIKTSIDTFGKLEAFSITYLTGMEHKITTILTTVSTLDQNLRALQEKAQTLDIFQYHINAWADHMKSIDEKLNLLKKSHDLIIPMEGKLTSMEYIINHLLTKADMVNEKLNRIYKVDNDRSNDIPKDELEAKLDNLLKFLEDQEKRDKMERKEMFNRLNAIQRQVSFLERHIYEKGSDSKLVSPVLYRQKSESNEDLSKISEDLNMLTQQTGSTQSLLKSLENKLGAMENTLKIANHNEQFIKEVYESQTDILGSCKSAESQIATFSQWSEEILKSTETQIDQIKRDISLVDSKMSNCTRNEGKEAYYTKAEIEEVKNTESDDEFNDIEPLFKMGCHEVKSRINGIYTFGSEDINSANRNYNKRYCDFSGNGVGWTVIQRRNLFEVQENFNRSWNDYKMGFGDLNKEFWFGNEFIHRLSYEDNLELRIELQDWTDRNVTVHYAFFKIDSEEYNYNLQIGGYHGEVLDSLSYHNDQDFSTFDRQNDQNNGTCCPCAESYGSGWWFNNCIDSNLNGIYRKTPIGHNYVGIIWEQWLHDYSLKGVKIMVRPKDL